MANTNLTSILDRAPSEVEKPKPLPVGTYNTVLVGLPREDKSAKKQTPFIEFTHKFISAGEDVDSEELAAALGDRALADVTMKNVFYLTEGSAWRLKEFLRDCGFDVESGDASMREMCEQSAGSAVGVTIIHRPSQDGQSMFAEIGKTVAAE